MELDDLIHSDTIYAMDEVTGRPINLVCHNGMLRVFIDEHSSIITRSAQNIPLGYEQVIVEGVAVGLNPPTGSESCVIYVESRDVRYRDDGVSPTDSLGMFITSGQTITYHGDLSAIKFIRTGVALSSTAKINVSYYRC